MEQTMTVKGMTCEHCVKAVKNSLMEIPKVEKVDVELATGKVIVHYQGEQNLSKWKAAIDEAGYEVAD